ncbi:MAG: hypothetical protein LV481_05800 [Methylacidiphilales bacterium]|nr:hypothetical protein [Candidatus Methylacidiphilales bacterium]
MRKQYHFQNSERGLLAWDVHRLIDLTAGFSVIDLPLEDISELNEPFWFSSEGDLPTCRKIAEHAKLINATSLDYPIILDANGRVMDGMHRVCEALITGVNSIKAVKLTTTPEPDFIGIPAEQLPY